MALDDQADQASARDPNKLEPSDAPSGRAEEKKTRMPIEVLTVSLEAQPNRIVLCRKYEVDEHRDPECRKEDGEAGRRGH